MSEARHTPGPWEVRQDFYIGRPGRFSLAEVKCGDVPADDVETHKANARLIAAGPDLFAALVDLLERAEVIEEDNSDDDPEMFAPGLLENARRAIARAEGASS